MSEFALLIRPALNPVYGTAASRLAVAELGVLGEAAFGAPIQDVRAEAIAGVAYVRFAASGLSEGELGLLADLSFAHALFQITSGGDLRPIPLRRRDVLHEDLLTIPKYRGKTNELFTKLLLNVALCSTAFPGELATRRFRVLDPLCGRGTTLSQALVYGFDATGLDVDARDFEAYEEFVRTWLKRKRLKHEIQVGNTRKSGPGAPRRFSVKLAHDKSLFRAGQHQTLTVLLADTLRARELCGAKAFDVIATDLPYGVQHGSSDGRGHLARAPVDLVREAAPGWAELLRPGGALALAFNTRVASRQRMKEVLAPSGLQVLEGGPYEEFVHWVDQSITRDVLVARRPLDARTTRASGTSPD